MSRRCPWTNATPWRKFLHFIRVIFRRKKWCVSVVLDQYYPSSFVRRRFIKLNGVEFTVCRRDNTSTFFYVKEVKIAVHFSSRTSRRTLFGKPRPKVKPPSRFQCDTMSAVEFSLTGQNQNKAHAPGAPRGDRRRCCLPSSTGEKIS